MLIAALYSSPPQPETTQVSFGRQMHKQTGSSTQWNAQQQKGVSSSYTQQALVNQEGMLSEGRWPQKVKYCMTPCDILIPQVK